MKKLILLALFLIILCGCDDVGLNIYNGDNSSSNVPEVIFSEPKHEQTENGDYIAYLRNALEKNDIETPTLLISKVDFKTCNMVVDSVQSFNMDDSMTSKGILISCYSESNYDVWFLVIDKGEIYSCLYIGNIPQSTPPLIYYTDIDGDGLDEIITHVGVPASGRTGPYFESSIYNWDGDSLQTFYNSRDIEHPENLIDTGFQMCFRDGYEGVVINKYTDTKTVFNASLYGFYDESGMINDPTGNISSDMIFDKAGGLADNFIEFEPFDIDNDGISEIIAMEAFHHPLSCLYSIGLNYVVLKFDNETNKLVVIKSAFWNEQSGQGDQQTFEANWYKS